MAVHGYRMSVKAGPVHGVGIGFSYQHIELQEDQREAIGGVDAPLYQGDHPIAHSAANPLRGTSQGGQYEQLFAPLEAEG